MLLLFIVARIAVKFDKYNIFAHLLFWFSEMEIKNGQFHNIYRVTFKKLSNWPLFFKM